MPAELASPSPVRLRPGLRLLVALGGCALLWLLPAPWSTRAMAIPLGLGLTALLERRRLASTVVGVVREVPPRVSLGQAEQVRLALDNASAASVRVELRDEPPAALRAGAAHVSLRVGAGERAIGAYPILPSRRGCHRFGDVYVRTCLGLGLWERVDRMPCGQPEVRCYPNLQAVHRYALAARTGLLERALQRRGRPLLGGGELDQLREYVPGDAYRDVDWKATAKRLRPILRVYGEDRSQTVLIALDVGRMMATRLGQLTKLDHAIQAALLLAHVALRAGDQVGALVFADDVLRLVPPMRGQAQYRRILEGLYDIQAQRTYVDHARLAEVIQLRQRKRALLLVFTDLTDATQTRPLIDQLARLRHKHLPVCVSMEDSTLRDLAERAPQDEHQAFVRAAASDLAEERQEVHARLRSAGIGLVEAPSGSLALHAVDRYLDIKRRRSL